MSASAQMSAPATSRRPSAPAQIDEAVQVLGDNARRFARMAIRDKIRLLEETMACVAEVAEAWVRDGHRAKGLPEDHGEEWLVGPVPTMRNLRLLVSSLERLDTGAAPVTPAQLHEKEGRVEVDVFPTDRYDAVLFAGFSAKQRMQEGLTKAEVEAQAGRWYRERDPEGGVSLILGAGNVSSIPPMDALYKAFAEGFVNIVKVNPVNEWVGPHLERAFAPFVKQGFLRVVYGGAEVGAQLVNHEAVKDVHITGSNHTHDLIVWGPPGAERDRRKAAGEPVLNKRITSELGNVSPVAIVPAAYSETELGFLARNVAAMVTNNASFNCNAAKMLIVSKGWSQRTRFVDMVASELSRTPTRLAYYPGAERRYERLTEGRSGVRKLGLPSKDSLPWTIVPDLDPSNAGDPAFFTEPFCGMISETALDESDPEAFLAAATAFMNDTLWGTLNAMIVVSPKHEASKAVGGALDRAVDALRYGTVAINHWPALAYATVSPAWGGHPSATLADVQSGIGWVHNTYLLEGIEKTVLRGPLTVFPKPVWFGDHGRVAQMGRRLLEMERSPSWRKVPGLVVTAVRG